MSNRDVTKDFVWLKEGTMKNTICELANTLRAFL